MPDTRGLDDARHVPGGKGPSLPEGELYPDGVSLNVEDGAARPHVKGGGDLRTEGRADVPVTGEPSPAIPGGDAPGVPVPDRVHVAEERLLKEPAGQKDC